MYSGKIAVPPGGGGIVHYYKVPNSVILYGKIRVTNYRDAFGALPNPHLCRERS
jgi:hypothetical protein